MMIWCLTKLQAFFGDSAWLCNNYLPTKVTGLLKNLVIPEGNVKSTCLSFHKPSVELLTFSLTKLNKQQQKRDCLMVVCTRLVAIPKKDKNKIYKFKCSHFGKRYETLQWTIWLKKNDVYQISWLSQGSEEFNWQWRAVQSYFLVFSSSTRQRNQQIHPSIHQRRVQAELLPKINPG